MPLNDERTDEYTPQHLYVEEYPLTVEELERLKIKEQNDDDDRGIIIIEIL